MKASSEFVLPFSFFNLLITCSVAMFSIQHHPCGYLLLALISSLVLVEAAPNPSKACPPFTKGSFTIQQYQLYPENADWDVDNCIVYFGYSSLTPLTQLTH